MTKYTKKALRSFIQLGIAKDVTSADAKTIHELARKTDQIGYSKGVNGITGGLFKNPNTGDWYVITERNSNLFIMM